MNKKQVNMTINMNGSATKASVVTRSHASGLLVSSFDTAGIGFTWLVILEGILAPLPFSSFHPLL